jgi:hypothetical protein
MIRRSLVATASNDLGLYAGMKYAVSLLTPRERLGAVVLFGPMVVNGFLGVIGLAGIVPFIDLMLTPEPLAGDRLVARVARFANITDRLAPACSPVMADA